MHKTNCMQSIETISIWEVFVAYVLNQYHAQTIVMSRRGLFIIRFELNMLFVKCIFQFSLVLS